VKTEPALLVCLDLGGTFTYAVNGGLTAVRAARLDIVGVVTVAMVSGLGLGAAQAVILGAVTGVGGGTLRDVLLGQIPSVLRRGLYAIPALSAAVITVAAVRAGIYGLPAAAGAVLARFLIRLLGVRYHLNAPKAPEPAQRTRRSRRTKAEVPVAVSPTAPDDPRPSGLVTDQGEATS
jgi:uncharacterized membrane protein YeiH